MFKTLGIYGQSGTANSSLGQLSMLQGSNALSKLGVNWPWNTIGRGAGGGPGMGIKAAGSGGTGSEDDGMIALIGMDGVGREARLNANIDGLGIDGYPLEGLPKVQTEKKKDPINIMEKVEEWIQSMKEEEEVIV